jgi:hypothetical protein
MLMGQLPVKPRPGVPVSVPINDKVDILWGLMESRLEDAISRRERTVQKLHPDPQEIVASLRTPAHLLSLVHSVVDEVIPDRLHMSCRNAASLSTRSGTPIRHLPTDTASGVRRSARAVCRTALSAWGWRLGAVR